jgi:hypothetical protein
MCEAEREKDGIAFYRCEHDMKDIHYVCEECVVASPNSGVTLCPYCAPEMEEVEDEEDE